MRSENPERSVESERSDESARPDADAAVARAEDSQPEAGSVSAGEAPAVSKATAADEQSAAAPTEPADDAPITSDSQTFQRAFKDFRVGFGQRELWLSLGWQDIKQRYRRSVLGPFWITIATGVQAAAIGLLYSALLGQPVKDYLPYVAVGIIVWNVINASILEGSDVFIANEGLIKQLPSALSVHVYRLVWRQLLFFAHNMLIYFVVLVAFGVWEKLHWTAIFAIPALGLLFLNAMWVSIVFGIFSTRYRDIAPILGSLTLMLFVLTPVMWNTKSLEAQGGQVSERAKLAEIVPTFHYLEIIRAPLLGDDQHLYHWLIVGAITVVGWIVAIFAMKQFRSRVPYWV
ncbi:putative ABC transporter permease protein [Nocardia brasiliensis NBRC 14402]|nr:putative ABC transporter permease protein [Nocardia brasiliensis NBRC 14402]